MKRKAALSACIVLGALLVTRFIYEGFYSRKIKDVAQREIESIFVSPAEFSINEIHYREYQSKYTLSTRHMCDIVVVGHSTTAFRCEIRDPTVADLFLISTFKCPGLPNIPVFDEVASDPFRLIALGKNDSKHTIEHSVKQYLSERGVEAYIFGRKNAEGVNYLIRWNNISYFCIPTIRVL